ncbi:hypothetical protein [Winogradskyella sediminis]|uniref:hypothetical protein n=1 Tax=Winogradskyella sediminis TaxID=1382466 RepID=UPI003AA83C6C
MKRSRKTLYAIYKHGNHLGNERGENADDAIKKYLIAALFNELSTDLEFVSLYTATVAIKNIHF